MRTVFMGVGVAVLAACSPVEEQPDSSALISELVQPASFDGADYTTGDEKIAHGLRISELMGCASCHGPDYTGTDFGAMIQLVEGLWATNITLTLPDFTDEELETLIRYGVHPDRDIYLMPSKQSQFLSDQDMSALIAYLRTIPPQGDPTPLPPDGFEQAVTENLPEDYWLWRDPSQPQTYHNAQEEAAYFAANRAPDMGEDLAQGRYIATAICSSCHGAALDGVGEPAGDIQGALNYTDEEFETLLVESITRNGETVRVDWGFGHESMAINATERDAAIAYVRALAEKR